MNSNLYSICFHYKVNFCLKKLLEYRWWKLKVKRSVIPVNVYPAPVNPSPFFLNMWLWDWQIYTCNFSNHLRQVSWSIHFCHNKINVLTIVKSNHFIWWVGSWFQKKKSMTSMFRNVTAPSVVRNFRFMITWIALFFIFPQSLVWNLW